MHYPSPDGTGYNDDEPDNILYPYDCIYYPEAGAIAESTSDEENIPTDNNDDDIDSKNISSKNSNEYIEAVPLENIEDTYNKETCKRQYLRYSY